MCVFAGVFCTFTCYADLTVRLLPSVAPPQPVGTPITWTARAKDGAAGSLDYQFSVADASGIYQVVQDYSETDTMTWAPSTTEGTFSIQVIARNQTAGESTTVSSPYTIVSRVTGTTPVISATANPLVALYSAPPCAVGSTMYVVFVVGQVSNTTNTQNCNGSTSMNFYVGGMAASTPYLIHQVVVTGTQQVAGPKQFFTTGAIPDGLLFPAITLLQAPGAATDVAQSVLLADHIGPNGKEGKTGSYFPAAYNLNGKVIWYYPGLSAPSQNGAFYLRPVAGGTFMLHANDPNSAWVKSQLWREIDLAGNTIRQTNATRMNEQINAAGYLGCTSFTHDAIRLQNGHTLILCTQEQIYPAGTQGATAPVDIAGDAIVDLDQNLQLTWYWSGYDHLDINRTAILGETVSQNSNYAPVVLAPVANDWLHSNSLNYIPSNGDVILSMRNQDWVIRINYANGTGDGSIVWTMGIDGNFSIVSQDPYPWFTHQHDVEYELGGTQYMSIYDNGNTRKAQNPGVQEDSRGVYLSIDETNLIVTPLSLIDLGGFSAAGGSAQLLDNGNLHFDDSLFGTPINQNAESAEYVPTPGATTGTLDYAIQAGASDYRTYRMISLYQLD